MKYFILLVGAPFYGFLVIALIDQLIPNYWSSYRIEERKDEYWVQYRNFIKPWWSVVMSLSERPLSFSSLDEARTWIEKQKERPISRIHT